MYRTKKTLKQEDKEFQRIERAIKKSYLEVNKTIKASQSASGKQSKAEVGLKYYL